MACDREVFLIQAALYGITSYREPLQLGTHKKQILET